MRDPQLERVERRRVKDHFARWLISFEAQSGTAIAIIDGSGWWDLSNPARAAIPDSWNQEHLACGAPNSAHLNIQILKTSLSGLPGPGPDHRGIPRPADTRGLSRSNPVEVCAGTQLLLASASDLSVVTGSAHTARSRYRSPMS